VGLILRSALARVSKDGTRTVAILRDAAKGRSSG
jgi:hypothetical protein